jgi:carboxyl-terminal processing protease
VPDIEVQQSHVEAIDEGVSRREADLRGRLQNDQADGQDAGGDGQPAGPKAQQAQQPPAEDYQLARAVDLLRGVAMFGARNIQ